MNQTRDAIINLDPTYFCRFPVRRYPNPAVAGRVQQYLLSSLPWVSESSKINYLQQDLEELILLGYAGSLDDRLETTIQFFSYFFLFDDILECLNEEEKETFMTRMLGIMRQKVQADPTNLHEVVVEDICRRFLTFGDEVVQTYGRNLLSTTCKFIMFAGNTAEKLQAMESLKSYKKYRIIEAGAMMAFSAKYWAYGLYLPNHLMELPALQSMITVTSLQTALINDLYSYRVEALRLAERGTAGGIMFNAVTVIMKESNIEAQAAMDVLKEEISKAEVEFVGLAEVLRSTHSGEERVLVDRFIEACEIMMAGNWKWSTFCGRYNLFDNAIQIES